MAGLPRTATFGLRHLRSSIYRPQTQSMGPGYACLRLLQTRATLSGRQQRALSVEPSKRVAFAAGLS